MKIQTSRESHRAEKRYTGVYQQQGRMLTDADWNELMAIVEHGHREALEDVVRKGVPRAGGLRVKLTPAGAVTIVPGHVCTDGALARLPGDGDIEYGSQADFPNAAALPAGPDAYTLYADVWDRTVTALEDAELRDAALHGADTCARTQRLVQVKWCPGAHDPEDPNVNPPRGDALVSLVLRRTRAVADPCDPCADIELGDDPSRIGNYAFRVEVHDVGWDADAGVVNRVTLKWSSENGAEQYAVDAVPESFRGDDWAYEFFNDTTERHLGVQLATAEGFPARGRLLAGYPDVLPDNEDDPDDPYLYVRRWDGFVELSRSGTSWRLDGDDAVDRDRPLTTSGDPGADGFVRLGSAFTANLRSMVLSVEMDGSVFVAGDYWNAPVREAVHEVQDVVLPASPPSGIDHRYLTLGRIEFTTNGGPPEPQLADPPSDAARRRLAFPSLTTLMASDVGIENRCAALYGDAENVQQALDELCEIDASDVAYTVPQCPAAAGAPPTVQSLLRAALEQWPDLDEDGRTSVRDILDALLCQLDASRIPYADDQPQTLKEEVDSKVNRDGDTMTGDLTIDADLVVEGDLTVRGSSTTMQTETVEVEDNILRVNRYDPQPTPRDIDAGLEVFRGGTAPNAQLIWDEGEREWKYGVENDLVTLGSGSVAREIHQAGHGFAVGQPIYYDAAVGAYRLARADSEMTVGVFLVAEVKDADTFTMLQAGYLDGLAGLHAGEYYFVSPDTAGELVPDEPAGAISNPILLADSETGGFVLPYRPSEQASREVQVLFDLMRPVGDTFVQWPNAPDPNTLFNGNGIRSQWVDTDVPPGCFLRARGGNANVAEHGELSGDVQDDQIQSHRHADQGHRHWRNSNHAAELAWRTTYPNGSNGVPGSNWDSYYNLDQVETGYASLTDPTPSRGVVVRHGSETRPRNVAVVFWRRVA